MRTIVVIPATSSLTMSVLYLFSTSDELMALKVVNLILAILACAFYFTTLAMFLLLYVDNSPFSLLPFASAANPNELKGIIFKALLGIYGGMAQFYQLEVLNMGFEILVLAGLCYLCVLQYKSPNILNNRTRNLREHSQVILTWVVFMNVIHMWITPGESLSLIFVFIGCIVVNWAWRWFKERSEGNLIYEHFPSLTAKNDILAYIYLMCQFVRDLHEEPMNLIKMEGMLS